MVQTGKEILYGLYNMKRIHAFHINQPLSIGVIMRILLYVFTVLSLMLSPVSVYAMSKAIATDANCRLHKTRNLDRANDLREKAILQLDMRIRVRLLAQADVFTKAAARHKCSVDRVSGCTILPDGSKYCVVHKNFNKTLKKNRDYLQYLDTLNDVNNLAPKTLKAISFYESRFRNVCNSKGYCGPFQIGRAAWSDFKPSRNASRHNPYHNAKVVPNLIREYRSVTKDWRSSIYSNFIHHNLGPGNVITMQQVDRGGRVSVKQKRRFVNAVCNNLPSSVRKNYCRGTGRSRYGLKQGKSISSLSSAYASVWQFNFALVTPNL